LQANVAQLRAQGEGSLTGDARREIADTERLIAELNLQWRRRLAAVEAAAKAAQRTVCSFYIVGLI
jgi:hypothetical protein